MKKNFVYAMMSAIALSGAVSLTSCSSNEEVTENNPTYDGNSVRTDFAFNITKASKETTRMTADIVQETGSFDFRGMTDMYLLPFHGVPATAITTNNANYPLGVLNNTSDITSSKSSKVYSLSIPVGTDNFLFYAKATRSAGTNFINGRVSSSFYGADGAKTTAETSPLPTEKKKKAEDIADINDIQFSLTSIQQSLGDDATKLAAYLTSIANTSGWAETVTLSATDGRYSSLADLYTKFTSDYNARSGSVESITRMILDLYKSAKAINAASSVSEVQTIANAIVAKTNPGTGVRIIVNENSSTNPDDWTASSANLTDGTFPAGTLGLPMGAAQLQWDDTNKQFVYNDSPYYEVNLIGGNHTTLSNYCYPAELLYFDNSPLRATSTYKNISNYPQTASSWDSWPEATVGTGWNDEEVTSSTRAVAMKNNINYGVSLLQSTVELTTLSLKDNKTAILNPSLPAASSIDQTITIGETYNTSDTREITLKGVLVGGQPGTVNWQMLPTSTAFDHVIYDKTLPEDATHNWNLFIPTSTDKATPFYTAVFDNYTTETDQKDVLVALEFVNNTGMDFYGVNGLIPAGNTFYLVGKLQVSTATGTLEEYPDGYRIPYATKTTASDASIVIKPRVFLQDHKAIATFKIGENSLQKAYSTIPDLRSTEVLFGLSVDLEWKNGLSFDVILGN